ncbi:Beta-galactosidase C-terminal domain [Paenibacillus taihuensis]|uniref:Beta-galactosidase C-terminal domain n=1 Tax=Paenibacillus taihuensis TaxID=1156355 RepID=UPI001FE6CD76|nr:Beta-galactosidase C-terminal domain [Paenibacillus taihuensis]
MSSLIEAPAEVEFGIRASEGDRAAAYAFLLNYSKQPATVQVKQAARDILTGSPVDGVVELPAYGVTILELL